MTYLAENFSTASVSSSCFVDTNRFTKTWKSQKTDTMFCFSNRVRGSMWTQHRHQIPDFLREKGQSFCSVRLIWVCTCASADRIILQIPAWMLKQRMDYPNWWFLIHPERGQKRMDVMTDGCLQRDGKNIKILTFSALFPEWRMSISVLMSSEVIEWMMVNTDQLWAAKINTWPFGLGEY